MKTGDLIIIAAVLLAAVAGLVSVSAAPAGDTVVITVDGTRSEYPIKHDTKLVIESCGYILTVVIEDGSVRVEQSDCPDGVCVHSGKINTRGESIVCIPARVTVKVKSDREVNGSADAIAG